MIDKENYILEFGKNHGISNYTTIYNTYKDVIDDIITVIDEDSIPENIYDIDYWYDYLQGEDY